MGIKPCTHTVFWRMLLMHVTTDHFFNACRDPATVRHYVHDRPCLI